MHRYQEALCARRTRVTSAVKRVNFSLGSALILHDTDTQQKKEAYHVVKTV